MREMGCESYMGEQGVEIVERWFRKVEKTMIHINIPEGLHVKTWLFQSQNQWIFSFLVLDTSHNDIPTSVPSIAII
jgi:hypothetical protein